MDSLDSQDGCLRGLVTEGDLALAEVEFPGICRYHACHRGEHRTFLDLLVAFMSDRDQVSRAA